MTLDLNLLCQEAIYALKTAGWSNSRRIPVWKWTSRLAAEGYDDFPAARNALTGLGDLTIQAGKARGPNYPNGEMIFDPLLAAWDDFHRIFNAMEVSQAKVFPLGLWRNDMTPLITPTGVVFAIGVFGVWRISSIEEFINQIVCADQPIDILSS
ncbi:hypothetical protein GCM10029978_032600 [Actinoallomurus acanthiterrae]